ncbi:hypothetical protein K0M31_016677 [Melipona bicolor]|uniref:Uncharacterized protein n=1 Tax=Melipona bicolor TaxID=60889 RepID=A0AA40KEQ5_9HYME|nr:hypothetical protein K0M31_016677 [Melipona bicolor]
MAAKGGNKRATGRATRQKGRPAARRQFNPGLFDELSFTGGRPLSPLCLSLATPAPPPNEKDNAAKSKANPSSTIADSEIS